MARVHLTQPTEPGQLARREHRDRWATGEIAMPFRAEKVD